MKPFIEIESTDNTNTIVFADKIQYVLEKGDGCIIGLDNGVCIRSGAKFKDLKKAIERLQGGEGE